MKSIAAVLLLLASSLMICARAQAAPPAKASSPCIAPAATEATTAGGNPGAFRDCQDTPEMIAVRGGEFRMGDLFGNGRDYEKPIRKLRVEPFAIARYEVTVAEWQRCVSAGACMAAGNATAGGRYPVTGVSWEQAQQYVDWLRRHTGKPYRLPSEVEWEYAARAGSEAQYTWGNLDTVTCRYANAFDVSGQAAQPNWTWAIACDDGHAQAAPVGNYPPNAWGLHDMLGNVWEWVADCWHANYIGSPRDASAWVEADCTKRVNRGGGWGNHPRSLRVSNRDGDRSDARSDGMGFRVAR